MIKILISEIQGDTKTFEGNCTISFIGSSAAQDKKLFKSSLKVLGFRYLRFLC